MCVCACACACACACVNDPKYFIPFYSQVRFNLLQYVVPEVKELYNWLEVDFHPLKLSGRVTKVNRLLVV